jgi:N-acetylmuramoyl-L-alanine amidase
MARASNSRAGAVRRGLVGSFLAFSLLVGGVPPAAAAMLGAPPIAMVPGGPSRLAARSTSGGAGPRAGSATHQPSSTAAAAPVVFLDPGHGGVDTGVIGVTENGTVVEEKTITLAVAQATAADLRADGLTVVLSRNRDALPGLQPSDYASGGTSLTDFGVLADLQRRIDRANANGAAAQPAVQRLIAGAFARAIEQFLHR